MKSSIPNAGGTFQPLRHRSGTMRDRLHGYTKRTLGAGGSVTEAVSIVSSRIILPVIQSFSFYTFSLNSKKSQPMQPIFNPCNQPIYHR